MNLWHDISPDRIRPDDFYAVIENEKVPRTNTKWIRKREL